MGNKKSINYLETGRVTIPQINPNLYIVPRIIVFKLTKDQKRPKLLHKIHPKRDNDKSNANDDDRPII